MSGVLHEARTTTLVDVLADALPRFSFDLIKIVRGYLVFPCATAHATPKLLLTFGWEQRSDKRGVGSCYGIACSPADNTIWVARAAAVQRFSDEGKFLGEVSIQRMDAWGIAFAANGEAYITERSSNDIAVCRPDGSVERRIGSLGSVNGQFYRPWNIAIDNKQGLLFVADDTCRVQVLTLDGGFVRVVGALGIGDGQFNSPRGIALSAAGEVGVADSQNHRVQIFDYNGKFLRKFGSLGSANGQLKYPVGLAVDQWIVCDNANNRVCVFAADGSFVTAFGEKGHGPGQLYYPHSVCVDAEGRILVGDDGKRVQVFAFGCEW